MPAIQYFPYTGPNRRSDLPVVEILLKFGPVDLKGFPHNESEIRDLLISGGILGADEVFPGQPLPGERMAWYTSLLVQTALLFQRKAGHRVEFFSISGVPEQKQFLAFLEHEHCDVGMTAVKLAFEVVSGKRRLLAEPFQMFSKFAGERLLPLETGAIIEAARRRDIPAIHLERNPLKRADFDELTGGRCIRPNGLLMLGHGEHQQVLDGTFSINRNEDFSGLFEMAKQQGAIPAQPGFETFDMGPAADALLDRLFPSKQPVRIPIIAITGTNGKTTTTRMINHIMSFTGRKTGMVCTDGLFINGRMVVGGDHGAPVGHMKVLTSKAVNFAVLETHHKGILYVGFAFRWCDIAICLNVTEDHLGEGGIETVEQMAEIKSALPERARQAVVLNADDLHCVEMLRKVTAKQVCLVSMEAGRDQLYNRHGKVFTCCCVLERVGEQLFLVVYEEDFRVPVIAVDSIPASFGGIAGFNVSNAMHAVAASFLSGVDIETIQTAMSSFRASYETTPGRLNYFDELPFRIIMDFAHNPDGIRRLCEFIDRQDVPGRKLVAFAGSINRADEVIRQMGRSMAGHFDYYFCKEHVQRDGKQPRTVAHLLQQGLIESGVAENQIAVKYHGKDVIFEIFDFCEPGDLLVMLMGHVEKSLLPGYIREYAGNLYGDKTGRE
jgi:UDP-N-acetylmuramyl tripeptide synthase